MRKQRIAECAPRWCEPSGVSFECPEADGGCDGRHAIPGAGPGAHWQISGTLENVTIVPSIACRGACQIHIVVTDGRIEFCSDSKSGPDWSKAEG